MITISKRTKQILFQSEQVRIDRWEFGVEIEGVYHPGSSFSLSSLEDRPDGFDCTLKASTPPIEWSLSVTESDNSCEISSRIRNTGETDLTLGRAVLLHADSGVDFGSAVREIRCLPLSGDLGPRRVYRIDDDECPSENKIKAQFYGTTGVDDRGSDDHSDTSDVALQAGFVTFKRCDTNVRFAHRGGRRIGSLEAWCDFAGFKLAPKAKTNTEVFRIAVGPDPYEQLESWASRAAELTSVRNWEDAPVGWLGWAWVDPFTVERYEDVVARNAEAVSRRLAGFGVGYVWVSIGNIAGGVPGRWTEWNYDRFPSGPEHLSGTLKRHGLKLGFWCGPYWICAMAATQLEELKGALLTKDDEPIIARPAWQYGDAGALAPSDRPKIYALDPSHPKAQEFLSDAFETWRRWGVRYYMIDFLEAGAGHISRHHYDRHFDKSLVAGPEVYHAGLDAIRRAAGDDTYMLTSTGPSIHNAGFADGIRTGNDFGEGRSLYPESFFYPATFVINGSGFWTGPMRALLNQAASYYTHRRLYINDSGNVLTVDKPISLSDARIFATIHVMSGGPTMIGDDIDRIDEERLSLIKATLPRPRQVARPLDLFQNPHPDYPRIFHRRIDRTWGRFDVVAVYNFDDRSRAMTIEFAELGLEPESSYAVFEFWNCEYRGTTHDAFETVVAPRSAEIYRITGVSGARGGEVPTVVGTDMHATMGEMEIADCTWDESTRTLEVTVERPAGETGNVFVRAPKGLRVENPSGLWIAKDAAEECLIVGARFLFDGDRQNRQIRFAPIA